MTKYREILRLHSLRLSKQMIADSCNVSKETINSVLKKAKAKNFYWPLYDNQTDDVLSGILFLEKEKHSEATKKRMPDYVYVRKELLRN